MPTRLNGLETLHGVGRNRRAMLELAQFQEGKACRTRNLFGLGRICQGDAKRWTTVYHRAVHQIPALEQPDHELSTHPRSSPTKHVVR
ncbi:hypothetical protein LF1_09200 [Rubripirellula obstinata]|uniref:Uncharacterized protein n=1 Tax=Rubripirellula obstinata TaxID=406547 RepID=A0A5B1CDV9_9BACT|nr:hypothetical protein LF1_09200 [Rubripirellula obstinata]